MIHNTKAKIPLLFGLLYGITIVLFAVYSFALMDLNITFFNGSWWNTFRSFVIQLGYFHRDWSFAAYASLVSLLFIFHILAFKKNYNPWKLALIIGGVSIFSYPFLSHDLFNYMFDAKIVTFYHQNPYFHKALDYPLDNWTRFMHWTHRTYPYGPSFLFITLLPSLLSLGKFLFAYLLFKGMFVGFYLLAVASLQKINTRSAVFFATNPFVIVEGLINCHNDLIGVSLAIFAYYLLTKKKKVLSVIMYILSGGIKYLTSFAVLCVTGNKGVKIVAFLLTFALIVYLSVTAEIQPWYFLTLFIFLPAFPKTFSYLQIFFAGLLFSYYPYIRFDGWVDKGSVDMKHVIIWVSVGLSLVYAFFLKKRDKEDVA